MATILHTPNGKFKAIIRNGKGRYLRSKTFTRKTDARICGLWLAGTVYSIPAICGTHWVNRTLNGNNLARYNPPTISA